MELLQQAVFFRHALGSIEKMMGWLVSVRPVHERESHLHLAGIVFAYFTG